MIPADDIRLLGLQKLGELPMPMPWNAPTPSEVASTNEYSKSLLQGGLGGGAAGAILGSVLRKNPLTYALLGVGAGALSGLLRHYDQAADPPGLSPVYTIPAGLRLGALTGAITGGLLGHLTPVGLAEGALAGLATGAVGGGLVSNLV